MRRSGILVFAGLIMLTATAAYADVQPPGISGTVQQPAPQPNLVSPGEAPEAHPLFWIGRLPVEVWAPVVPPYDTTADRNGASNPLWGPP
jgi:hypothetical protein